MDEKKERIEKMYLRINGEITDRQMTDVELDLTDVDSW
jgi:hypothetical protein